LHFPVNFSGKSIERQDRQLWQDSRLDFFEKTIALRGTKRAFIKFGNDDRASIMILARDRS
jgi:phage regulator Rha-like protein